MTTPKTPVMLTTSGKLEDALALSAAILKANPGKPVCHLDFMSSLALLKPGRLNLSHAGKLLKYFCQTGDFPSALECFAFMGLAPGTIEDELLKVFLKAFGSDAPETSRPPAPKDAALASSPLSYRNAEDLVTQSENIWDEAIKSIFMPPPIPGKKMPLFKAMSPESLALVLRKGKIRLFTPGDVVLKQGNTDSSFFILIRGVIEVIREQENSEIRLGFLRSGSFFGEMALVTSAPRSATTRCTEPSYIFEIEWSLLNEILGKDPALATELAEYTRFRLLKSLMATSVLFRTLPSEAKVELMAAFKPLMIDAESVVISEGKPSPGLFLVASGEMLVVSGKGSDETLLSTLKAGDVFGEISLIREGDAKATVKCGGDDAVLLELSREDFQDLAVRFPELLSHVYQVAIERTRMNEKINQAQALPADDLLL
ncbi:cyclic nucleotide-binding domain-containing protein [Myxococcota bacterium]|nr:cyclic nucleotide-binding domain-containing protein [Myxococcota bacterium]MBU1383167.1 cyclic nucleotide-binding domain-containing protein [Myxococcota bacterium]MBU1497197.1 cyclic nucleotide-binding domain-containing protein [Myxococcota bacterium]